jgi:hypothetical protein
MAEKLIKTYPLNFSDDITDIVSSLSLKNGKEAGLYGSSRFKNIYATDYDFYQEVKYSKSILKDFQDVIKKLLKKNDVYIGDIKSGMIPELKVIDDDLNESNYNSKLPKMIKKVNYLYKNKHIDEDEKEEAIKILKPNMKEYDISIIKHELRYEITRWKPDDILKGFVNYRNIKVDFNKYLISDSVTKIDSYTWVNGIRYGEITMVYIFMENGRALNRGFQNMDTILRDAIPYLEYKGKYMKICKRINAIERLKREPNKLLLRRLYRLFNSDLGILSQVNGDITVLIYLIENIRVISKTKFKYEINMLKFRLGNMTNKKYIKKKNQEHINKLINILERDVVDVKELENLQDIIFKILQSEALKNMKKWKLYPIPDIYLPETIVGGKLNVGDIRELMKASYKKDPPKQVGDFNVDSSLSTDRVKVYHNDTNNQTVIIYRGTLEWYDWGNNVIYGLFGKTGYKLTGRFKEAKRVFDATVKKYGIENITTLGHSQGGIPAEILGKNTKEIITLNKATRPFSNTKEKNQYDISTTGDVVHKLNPFSKSTERDVSVKSKTSNPLTEHYVTSIDFLNPNIEIGVFDEKKMKPTDNKVPEKIIKMKSSDFIKEHKKLIPILKKGSKYAQMKEAMEQQKELEKRI